MATEHFFVYLTAPFTLTTIQREYIVAFPRQNWFRERSAILRYTHIVCVVDYEGGDATFILTRVKTTLYEAQTSSFDLQCSIHLFIH